MGGTLISLRNYLALLDHQKVQADVMSLSMGAGYGAMLPNCKLIHPNIWLMYVRDGLPAVGKLLHKFLGAIQKLFIIIFHYDLTPFYMRIGGWLIGSIKYDCVICFSESISRFVCYFPARKRIAWVHCEYTRIYQEGDQNYYSRFDNIVCVSHYGKKVFDKCIPELSDNTVALHNVIDVDYILQRAREQVDIDKRFDSTDYTIVTIGRMDPIKQFTKIPAIASAIKQATDRHFKWYIIGDGNSEERALVENEITRCDMSSIIVLLGEKENVYPYIAKSDLYVNTSKSEAYSLVNNEAKVLGVPVVTNNFECAKETITDGVDGVVTSIDHFPEAILSIMSNRFSAERSTIDNTPSLEMFYNLI